MISPKPKAPPIPTNSVAERQKKQTKVKTNAEHNAFHYGFDLVDIKESVHPGKSEEIFEEEKVKLLKFYSKENDLKREIPQKMMYYNKAILHEKTGKKKRFGFGFDIIGVENGLAEALIIQAAISMLKDEGYKDLSVEINAIGDRESVKKFEKELIAFYKKNTERLKTNDHKKLVTGKAVELFCSNQDHMDEVNSEAPKPMYYLNDESSKHFKEVLEYLEEIDAPYSINDCLTGSKNYFSKVIFLIKGRGPKEKTVRVLGRGGRYDELASDITRKRKIAAVGLSLDFKAKEKAPEAPTHDISLHLIKIGFNARLKSLELMEVVKKIGAPIGHSIDETKISRQIDHAVDNNATHALIIGHKEANERKVVVRDLETFSQEEVLIADLPKYARKLLKKTNKKAPKAKKTISRPVPQRAVSRKTQLAETKSKTAQKKKASRKTTKKK